MLLKVLFALISMVCSAQADTKLSDQKRLDGYAKQFATAVVEIKKIEQQGGDTLYRENNLQYWQESAINAYAEASAIILKDKKEKPEPIVKDYPRDGERLSMKWVLIGGFGFLVAPMLVGAQFEHEPWFRHSALNRLIWQSVYIGGSLVFGGHIHRGILLFSNTYRNFFEKHLMAPVNFWRIAKLFKGKNAKLNARKKTYLYFGERVASELEEQGVDLRLSKSTLKDPGLLEAALMSVSGIQTLECAALLTANPVSQKSLSLGTQSK